MVYKPTDRERQRYVTYSGSNPLPTYRTLFGVHGEAAAGIQERGRNTIRINNTHVDKLKTAICLTAGSRSVSVKSNITKAQEEH